MREVAIRKLEALVPIYDNIIKENACRLEKITESLKYYSKLADKLEQDDSEYCYCLNVIKGLMELGVETKDFILNKEKMKSQLLTCIDMLKKGEDMEVIVDKLYKGQI